MRTRRRQRACRRRSGRGGSAKLAGCRQSHWLRCRGVICRSLSGRRSRSFTLSSRVCERSRVEWVAHRRRSRGSCAATRRLARIGWSIGRRLRSGTRSDARAVRRSQARRQRCAAGVRAGTPCRHDRQARRRAGARTDCALRSVVGTVAVRTGGGRKSWSPEQIANRLRIDFPDDDSMRISHEAIYQALYVQGRGALRRELVACLRTGRALRVPRARTRRAARSSSPPR